MVHVAVKTVWHVRFECGHSEDRDLSDRKADARAGFARWLATSKCTACWRAEKTGDSRSKAEWLADQRAKELVDIEAWEQRTSAAILTGSDKAVEWGRRCRFQVMRTAYEALVEAGDMAEAQFDALIETPAGRLDSASWWIDNRDTAPEDVAEIVSAAQSTAAVSNVNPF